MRSLLVLALSVALAACANVDYRKAVAADTVEALEAYLRTHPAESPERAAVATRLQALAFEQARVAHSVIGYKRFLELYPEAAQAAQAKALLESLRFNAASRAATSAALRAFLHEHPDGAHAGAARELLSTVDLRELSTVEQPQQLRELLRGRPEDPARDQVEARIDVLSFEQALAGGARPLMRYLKDFPSGARRREAQLRLFELKVRSSIVSGFFEEAEGELRKSPLAEKLPALREQLRREREEGRRLSAGGAQVQAALPAFYLRSLADLERALQAPDALDRWQAAQELSQHISARTIDPLLSAIRTARNPKVRWEAFKALRNVVRALPHDVAQYELAIRLEALSGRAADEEVHLATAVLLDLSGELAAAATEYQRAFSADRPDPVILRRWVELRRERSQHFSAAVAARKISLWVAEVTSRPAVEGQDSTIQAARQLCAAVLEGRWAEAQIAASRTEGVEFPEDLAQFAREAERARRLGEAALADAELALRTQDPTARLCEDDRVSERLAEAERRRRAALAELRRTRHPLATLAWMRASQHDPSFEVRAEAEKAQER